MLNDENPYCRIGYELDICGECIFYDATVDYCSERLFESEEKEGRRLPVEICLNFIDIQNLRLK